MLLLAYGVAVSSDVIVASQSDHRIAWYKNVGRAGSPTSFEAVQGAINPLATAVVDFQLADLNLGRTKWSRRGCDAIDSLPLPNYHWGNGSCGCRGRCCADGAIDLCFSGQQGVMAWHPRLFFIQPVAHNGSDPGCVALTGKTSIPTRCVPLGSLTRGVYASWSQQRP